MIGKINKLFALACLFIIANSHLTAQEGIHFESGTWKEVLSKAKTSNKMVFIDVYTSWCGPCKAMVKNIFPLKEVAEKFNANFINYKIDAEKGEGVEIAKKFGVQAYPTYLFVNGDGILVYRSLGSMPADKFLSEASVAISEFSDPKPFAVWEDEYEQKKQDKKFLWEYLQKRSKLRLNSGDVLDQYFKVCSKEEILASPLMKVLSQYMQMNTDGPFFQFLLNNKEEVKKSISPFLVAKFDAFLVFVAKADLDRAVEKSDEKLLEQITKILLQLPPDEYPIEWRVGETRMKYFTLTDNAVALTKELNSYSKAVLNYDVRKIRTADSLALDQFEKDIASGKTKNMSPESLEMNREYKSSSIATSYAYRIRDIGRSVLNVINDKKELDKAINWINYAIQFKNHFTVVEVKAGLLYKSGKIAEAKNTLNEAIELFHTQMAKMNISSDKSLARLEDTRNKMNEGKSTWGIEKKALQTKVMAVPKK